MKLNIWQELRRLMVYFSGAILIIIAPIAFMVSDGGERNAPSPLIISLTVVALVAYALATVWYLLVIKNDYSKTIMKVIFAYSIIGIIFLIIIYSLNLSHFIINENETLLLVPIIIIFGLGILGSSRFSKAYSNWRSNDFKEKKEG